MRTATAIAHPNIAFIKYWGMRDAHLHIPANSSISMNMAGLITRTQVVFNPDLEVDSLIINGRRMIGPALARVGRFLDRVRQMAGIQTFGSVISENNFPTGAGIASSASAFAALSLAASTAAGLSLDEMQLSRLARTGSGSACRSVPGGFVEWRMGESDLDSFAYSVAPVGHWDLVDCVAVVSQAHKPTGSTEGHKLASSSPLNQARLSNATQLLARCRTAIQERDFDALATVTELDCHMMHAVMMTSSPALLYWQAATITVMQAVQEIRRTGIPACYTIDAGPNVHVLTTAARAEQVTEMLAELPGVLHVLQAPTGSAACLDTD